MKRREEESHAGLEAPYRAGPSERPRHRSKQPPNVLHRLATTSTPSKVGMRDRPQEGPDCSSGAVFRTTLRPVDSGGELPLTQDERRRPLSDSPACGWKNRPLGMHP